MIPLTTPPVDSRDTNAVLDDFQNRQHGYLPQWNPGAKSAGAAIGPILARLIYAILQRLNQAPNKDKLAFLDLLGLRLVPAQPARVPIVFSLSQGSADTSAPEGTQVAAPPPPGSTQQIVFSTEQDAAVAAAQLSEVFSLWPGTDQYLNHSAALAASQPFTLFQTLQMQPTDHILYLAHSKFLAFAGNASLKVTFDLSQQSSSELEMAWEYWDGQVWRGFISNQPTCLDPVQDGFDGTNGLTASGSVQLDVQGAQTAQTTVNGVNSYWIRARLTQPLLPDANQLLPEAETLRLSTLIDQALELKLSVSYSDWMNGVPFVNITDDSGQALLTVNSGSASAPVDAVTVTVTDTSNGNVLLNANANSNITAVPTLTTGTMYQFTVTYFGITGTTYQQYGLSGAPCSITIIVKVEGLSPDKAYFETKTLDTTKAFNPLGPNPTSGSTFYFKQTEVLSKPGATVSIYAAGSLPNPGNTLTGGALPHTLNWEYWNGFAWTLIFQGEYSQPAQGASPSTGSGDFTAYEILQFVVPNDLTATTVNNDNGLWIRVRLATGGYGLTQTVTATTTDSSGKTTSTSTASFTVPQPPSVGSFLFGYSWVNGPYPFEQVFAYNDFAFTDYTSNALWPGSPFPPYQLAGDVTPAVYLGFTKQLPVNNFGVFFDVDEQPGVTSGPAMIWEYWNGGGWEPAVAEDGTADLALAGMITFIPAADAQPLARFDTPLYWLRGRLKEDGPPNQTTINQIYTNAVWADQWQTFTNSPLGTSTGVPSQLFTFNQIPVLPGQQIAVQELSGPRANTEWRGLAMQVVPDDPDIVTELEALLAAEGPQTDIIIGNVHLVRDSTKSVTAVWIQWAEVQNFFESGPNDRVYVLDHALGRLFLGNGDEGMIPPLGALIQATSFVSGGGLAGNVAASTITQLLGAVSGAQGVTNPRPAEGGADGETLEQFQQRAPSSLRNRGRAIVPADYEALAQQASAGVAVARAFSNLDASGVTRPGWITVMIIPQSQSPQPTPSAGLRQDVLNFLLANAPADVAAAQSISVVGPTYLPVDVKATLAPINPAQAGTVEQDALDALAAFFNPLTGGPGGLGWDVGRGLYASDVAAVLGDVTGVDYVQDLALYVNGVLQGDQVQVPSGQIVVAGQFTLSLVLPVGG
ncbi:MAG TPA: putative baseplate assembly protein [Candidatus Bathyarchaeia archaeon]|nr:putative baseplate assembly protein [Candidatus Bathyarchaeia archaeon]